MALVFYLVGAIATFLFILNNLWQTVRRKREVGFHDMLLAFFAALMPIVALLLDNVSGARFDTLEELLFLLIIPLLIIHIALTVIDLVRPKRRRSGRGILGIGIAILLLIATVGYNLSAQFIELTRDEVVLRPTPINEQPRDYDPCQQDILGTEILNIVLDNIAVDADIDRDELLERFVNDGETSFGQLVRANDGNPTQTVEKMVQDFRQFVAETSAICQQPDGEGPQLDASNLNVITIFVRSFLLQAVEWPFEEFLANTEQVMSSLPGAGGNTAADDVPVVQATPNSTQLQETRAALVAAIPSVEVPLTPTPSTTPTITPSYTPTVTRTPYPTFSPTPTRERFVTATPTATATLPNPCLATAVYNVNMRTLPDMEESEVVQTIPFEALITVYAPNEDQTWWYGQYEGEDGWINDTFIRVTDACYDLPPRHP
ncbi:MAG: hypothetical protein KC708_12710 [Anaerolineae bacterium]|nr:hypothetical protein [Anaerolineae bacterium]